MGGRKERAGTRRRDQPWTTRARRTQAASGRSDPGIAWWWAGGGSGWCLLGGSASLPRPGLGPRSASLPSCSLFPSTTSTRRAAHTHADCRGAQARGGRGGMRCSCVARVEPCSHCSPASLPRLLLHSLVCRQRVRERWGQGAGEGGREGEGARVREHDSS